MILRQSTLRLGRQAFSRPATAPWPRYVTTHAEIDRTAASLENSQQQVRAIESVINTLKPSDAPLVTPETDVEYDRAVVANYHDYKNRKRLLSPLDSNRARPPQALSPQNVTLESLLVAQAHLGHATSLWHPGNQRYIFGIRQGIHIISLDIIAAHLRRAAKIVSEVCERAGLVLFVGNRRGQRRLVVEAAQMAGACHLFERWIAGSITNAQLILGQCALKLVDEFDRELPGQEDHVVGKAALKPDLVVCLNPLENYNLLHECRLNNIPTIGIIDTNVNPTWVTYPIPANDDSMNSVALIAKVLGRAGGEGQQRRRAAAMARRLAARSSQG